MKQEVLDYIKGQRVGVLAVEMLDGSPHGSTVHFAYTEEPLMFLFETNRKYRKCEALFGRRVSRASFVVGVDENDLKTLQMDGNVRLVNDKEKKLIDEVYFEKFPNKRGKKYDPSEVVLFVFIPTWWRFTDWTKPQGKVILTSE